MQIAARGCASTRSATGRRSLSPKLRFGNGLRRDELGWPAGPLVRFAHEPPPIAFGESCSARRERSPRRLSSRFGLTEPGLQKRPVPYAMEPRRPRPYPHSSIHRKCARRRGGLALTRVRATATGTPSKVPVKRSQSPSRDQRSSPRWLPPRRHVRVSAPAASFASARQKRSVSSSSRIPRRPHRCRSAVAIAPAPQSLRALDRRAGRS